MRANLVRIEERAPADAEELARCEDLQESVVRNLAIHRHDTIDWIIVHRVCTESLEDLRRFAREVQSWTERDDA